MSYSGRRRGWSDSHLPQVKAIIGPYLLQPSSFEQDVTEATDLIVLHARDMRIACRIRELQYLRGFDNQFTIRSRVDGAGRTELRKILEGWGDWLFYGFGTGEPDWDVAKWWIINLRHFVYHYAHELPWIMIKREIPNGDGTYFAAFDLTKFKPEPPILVAASHPLPAVAA